MFKRLVNTIVFSSCLRIGNASVSSNSSSLYISLQCKQRIFLGLGLGTGAVMQSLVGDVEQQSIYS